MFPGSLRSRAGLAQPLHMFSPTREMGQWQGLLVDETGIICHGVVLVVWNEECHFLFPGWILPYGQILGTSPASCNSCIYVGCICDPVISVKVLRLSHNNSVNYSWCIYCCEYYKTCRYQTKLLLLVGSVAPVALILTQLWVYARAPALYCAFP